MSKIDYRRKVLRWKAYDAGDSPTEIYILILANPKGFMLGVEGQPVIDKTVFMNFDLRSSSSIF
jgi:hypothetical protein